MSERSRKRSLIEMPGEGTGVPGVDPLVYREPGDAPEVDALLVKLRGGAPGTPHVANSQGAERGKKSRAAKGKGGESARDQKVAGEQVAPKGDAVKRGINPQWLTFAAVAIVGLVMVLLLILILSRTQAPAEGARDATAKEVLPAPSASPAIPAAPSAAPGTTADVVPAAPASTAAPSVAVSSSAAPTQGATAAPPVPKALTREKGPEQTPQVRTLKPKVAKTPEF